MPAAFLDLPAEVRIQIYELVFKPKERAEVRTYLTNRMARTLAKRVAGTNRQWKIEKPTGAPAFMATCQQVYSESCATLYANVTFLCERISDFSEFARTLGSTHSHLIEKLEITLHNYYILAKLPVLTGLKTLVVSPPEWALGSVARAWSNIRPRPDWRWVRKSETIKALKHFADAQTSLERITFVERGWPGCTADAATEVKEALSEIDEHIRYLRSS